MKQAYAPSAEQDRIFNFSGKNMVVSASAGSGKTTTMIWYISRLVSSGQPIKRILVLTFTKAAANEMRERLWVSLVENSDDQKIRAQIDDLFTSDICTIHAFLEKLIKRNISQFPQLEGFVILDEAQSSNIKTEAFAKALEKFKQQDKKGYVDLYMSLRSFETAQKMVLKLEDFLSAQANQNQILESMMQYDLGYKKTIEYLTAFVKEMQNNLKQEIDLFPIDNEKVEGYLQDIRRLCFDWDDLRQACQKIAPVKLVRQPSLGGYDKRGDVVQIKNHANKLISFAAKLSPGEDSVWQTDGNKKLCNHIFTLYKLFAEEYANLKLSQNALDFNDLEKQSENLLSDEQILAGLQQNYDYVFIDEYQDTNPVQEKIVKLLSAKCKFVAIGDPKQGIYGFRNATSEIILKDSKNFAKASDGTTEFLSENYRSDKKILAFVNNVFKQIMTEKNAGINYAKSSVLHGKKNCPKTKNPVVQILIAEKPKKKKAAACEHYDIFSDKLSSKSSELFEAKMIAVKIEEFLASEFVDPKTKARRKVKPSDIAILTRSKGDVCDGVMNELRTRHIPFVSTLSSSLNQKAHTQLVESLLELCISQDNDIALASYLYSPLCLIDMDELASMRADNEQTFSQKVQSSENEKVKNALLRLQAFKTDCLFLGAKQALEKLFFEKEYYIYLKSQIGENAVAETQSLLGTIAGFENDKDLPGLLTYLKSPISFSNASGQNAVTISTIHASKGLEYPIVFLIGTGKGMIRNDTESFKLDSEFGLGTMVYDQDEWAKWASLKLVAARAKSVAKERVGELMVLYVALTRAKSHLVITGSLSGKEIDSDVKKNFNEFGSFLSLILSTNPEKAGAKVVQVEEIESLPPKPTKIETKLNATKLKDKVFKYLNFVYPYLADTKTKQKTSVTELNHSGETFAFSGSDQFVQEGNAYHEALKILDFSRANSVEEIISQLNNSKIDENYLKILDFSLLLEDINLIKPFLANKTQIKKEWQFTMRLPLNEGARMVQGTVDLFLKGDKNILIDYKYTREKNMDVLLKRYQKQLELYKKAIEESENIVVDEVYLISLKNKKIIKY